MQSDLQRYMDQNHKHLPNPSDIVMLYELVPFVRDAVVCYQPCLDHPSGLVRYYMRRYLRLQTLLA